jgi:hypothetical protein
MTGSDCLSAVMGESLCIPSYAPQNRLGRDKQQHVDVRTPLPRESRQRRLQRQTHIPTEIRAERLNRPEGRLGRDPWFRSEGEQHIAGFPLAVNDPENRTTWHKVVVFDATADQLHEAYQKGSVRKGRLVDVTGQTVVREEPRANGGVKKNPEFHASAVARVQSSRPER